MNEIKMHKRLKKLGINKQSMKPTNQPTKPHPHHHHHHHEQQQQNPTFTDELKDKYSLHGRVLSVCSLFEKEANTKYFRLFRVSNWNKR